MCAAADDASGWADTPCARCTASWACWNNLFSSSADNQVFWAGAAVADGPREGEEVAAGITVTGTEAEAGGYERDRIMIRPIVTITS